MRVDPVVLDTIDGVSLYAEVLLPPSPVGATVVCHPHPQYGGDLRNVVVGALSTALAEAGFAVVRFDFRGAGRSEGEHDGGDAERLDVVAALDLAVPLAGDGRVVLCGYSFGALVALSVTDVRVDRWCAVAPPLAMAGTRPLAATDHRPKLLLVAEHDQFTAPSAAVAATEHWANTTLETVPMADHFLGGRTDVVARRAVAFSLEP